MWEGPSETVIYSFVMNLAVSVETAACRVLITLLYFKQSIHEIIVQVPPLLHS